MGLTSRSVYHFYLNPYWKEIHDMIATISDQRAEGQPNIVAIIFTLKLRELIDNLRKRMHFNLFIAGT